MASYLLGNTAIIGIAAAVLILLLGAGGLFARFRPKKLDMEKFEQGWQEIQHFCRRGETWSLAVIDADKLLDSALKKRRFKGRTMGERLVSAQRQLSDNDRVWYGHKLRNKIVHDEMSKLHRRDVQMALRGFRQALRDLGALQ